MSHSQFQDIVFIPTSKNQKATSLWTLGCHKPVIPVVTFLTPLTLNSKSERIDRPSFPSLYSYWKSKSSQLLPFCSTWDFCSHWADLRTPVLLFNRCAAPAKLLSMGSANRALHTGLPHLLGSTNPCPIAVHMEPFSTSVFKVLIWTNRYAHTQTSLNWLVGCWCKDPSSHFHCASRFTRPWTRTYVRLLGPCFKTGRIEPFSQRRCVREMLQSQGPAERGNPLHRQSPATRNTATRHAWTSPQMSSTKHIHSTAAELPCPWRFPRLRTDVDTQGKKQHAHPDQKPLPRLRWSSSQSH